MAPNKSDLRAIYTLLYNGRGDATIEEIAEKTGLDRPTVEKGLEDLVEGGLVVSSVHDTHFGAVEE